MCKMRRMTGLFTEELLKKGSRIIKYAVLRVQQRLENKDMPFFLAVRSGPEGRQFK